MVALGAAAFAMLVGVLGARVVVAAVAPEMDWVRAAASASFGIWNKIARRLYSACHRPGREVSSAMAVQLVAVALGLAARAQAAERPVLSAQSVPRSERRIFCKIARRVGYLPIHILDMAQSFVPHYSLLTGAVE